MSIMLVRRKICPFCKKSFSPDYRHGDQQKTCGALECQRQRRHQATAQRKKTIANYHRDHYHDYVKPWRERRKALPAEAVSSAMGFAAQDDSLPPVLLTQHLCEEVTAHVNQCFTRLQQRLRQAA